MSTKTKMVTRCDNHVHCGQSIEHETKWPYGWGHVTLITRDHERYVSRSLIDRDLCPSCLKAVERAILRALELEGKDKA